GRVDVRRHHADTCVGHAARRGPRRTTRLSRAETVDMLQQVPLFKGLTNRQLTAVAKVVDHLSVGAGEVLVKEQDFGTRLLIIRQGTAEVRRQGVQSDGSTGAALSRRLATVGPGDFVGELSLIDGRRTAASVVAETPLDALVIYRS